MKDALVEATGEGGPVVEGVVDGRVDGRDVHRLGILRMPITVNHLRVIRYEGGKRRGGEGGIRDTSIRNMFIFI